MGPVMQARLHDSSKVSQIAAGGGIIAPGPVGIELGDGDSGKDADNGNHNQKFYQGKTVLLFFRCHYKQFSRQLKCNFSAIDTCHQTGNCGLEVRDPLVTPHPSRILPDDSETI